MFHNRTGQISALLMLFALTSPMAVQAYELPVPAAQTQPVVDTKSNPSYAQSIDAVKFETWAKVSETKQWVKDQPVRKEVGALLDDLEQATDKLQDKVAPAGHSMKTTLKKLPGKGLAQLGDRTVTVYGLILMMAFGLVVFLLGLSNPMSRLGGRH